MKTNARHFLRATTRVALRTSLAVRAIALSLMLPLSAASLASEQVSVTITGLEDEPLANVRASLRIQTQSGEENLQSATIADLHASAEREIKEALQPFGYYRPSIDAKLQEPDDNTARWRASYVRSEVLVRIWQATCLYGEQ